MIYLVMKKGLAYRESHKILCEAFGSIALGKSTVSKLPRVFEFGRSHFDRWYPFKPTVVAVAPPLSNN